MDPSKFKTTTTSRGFTYYYYYSPSQQAKPTLIFIHGFPSTHKHWEKIATYLQRQGYGVIVPDMLGYGGSSKPLDTAAYVYSGMSRDVVDILDAEGIEKAIAVGHDWGSILTSRIANYYPERFIAYAFLVVAFKKKASGEEGSYEALMALTKAVFGYELFGYWPYIASGELDEDFRQHPETFVNLWFPQDPAIWKTHMAPPGAMRDNMRSGFRTPFPAYLSEEEVKEYIDAFKQNGFKAPGNWYNHMVSGLASQDDSNIPESKIFPPADAPVFFGGGTKDHICLAKAGYLVFGPEGGFKNHNVTIRDFEGDHWIILSHADEISMELERWIEDAVINKGKL